MTVEDIVQLALPPKTRWLAGRSGGKQSVTWAYHLRSNSAATDLFEGGELVLLSLNSPAHVSQLSPLVVQLLKAKVAGLVVALAPGVPDPELDQLNLAEANHFPLLVISQPISLTEVSKTIVGFVLDDRGEQERQAVKTYRHLAEQVIEGKGLPGVAQALAQIVGKAVTIEDSYSNLLASANLSGSPGENWQELIQIGHSKVIEWMKTTQLASTEPPVTRLALQNGSKWLRVVAPIVLPDEVSGYLSIWSRDGAFVMRDELAAGRAAAVCAMEMVKLRAILETESRIRGDFFEDLLSGNFTTEAIINRGRFLGYNLSVPHLVMIFDLDHFADYITLTIPGNEKQIQVLKNEFITHLSNELVRRKAGVLLWARSDDVTVLYPCENAREAEGIGDIAEQIRAQTEKRLGRVTISCGVGRFYPAISDLPTSYREARQALQIGVNTFGLARTTSFGDLGIYRLLFHLQDAPELRAFYNETLAKLVEYDTRNNGELLRTLEAFFACHGNLTQTAQKLYLHRNTLIYRMHRIQEISGINLDDAERRLSLQLGLLIRQFIEHDRPKV